MIFFRQDHRGLAFPGCCGVLGCCLFPTICGADAFLLTRGAPAWAGNFFGTDTGLGSHYRGKSRFGVVVAGLRRLNLPWLF